MGAWTHERAACVSSHPPVYRWLYYRRVYSSDSALASQTGFGPWLAVVLLGINRDLGAARWLGDFERCMAWLCSRTSFTTTRTRNDILRRQAIPKIISGGQTGADRAALDWALSRKLPCGGWCPKGRKAEDGIIPETYPCGNRLRPPISSGPNGTCAIATVPFSFQCRPL